MKDLQNYLHYWNSVRKHGEAVPICDVHVFNELTEKVERFYLIAVKNIRCRLKIYQ